MQPSSKPARDTWLAVQSVATNRQQPPLPGFAELLLQLPIDLVAEGRAGPPGREVTVTLFRQRGYGIRRLSMNGCRDVPGARAEPPGAQVER